MVPLSFLTHSAVSSSQVNDWLWVCSEGPFGNKGWLGVTSVCNEAGGFYLPSVGPMTFKVICSGCALLPAAFTHDECASFIYNSAATHKSPHSYTTSAIMCLDSTPLTCCGSQSHTRMAAQYHHCGLCLYS